MGSGSRSSADAMSASRAYRNSSHAHGSLALRWTVAPAGDAAEWPATAFAWEVLSAGAVVVRAEVVNLIRTRRSGSEHTRCTRVFIGAFDEWLAERFAEVGRTTTPPTSRAYWALATRRSRRPRRAPSGCPIKRSSTRTTATSVISLQAFERVCSEFKRITQE